MPPRLFLSNLLVAKFSQVRSTLFLRTVFTEPSLTNTKT